MLFKTPDTRKIYYEIKGNQFSSEVIVFLNGLSQSTLAWAFMIPMFEKEYKLIMVDFIFQGQSDKKGNYKNFDEHALDIVQLMKSLNLDNAHICGISYGSLVAQQIAVNYPHAVRKLILLSTFAHKTEYFKAVELSWKRAVEIGGYNMLLDVMLPYVLSERYFENPIIPISILKLNREEINNNSDSILKLMQATEERKDYREELTHVVSKTLIVHGLFDKLIPIELAKEVSKYIKNSEFVVVENVGHTLNLEAALETSNIILAFLKHN